MTTNHPKIRTTHLEQAPAAASDAASISTTNPVLIFIFALLCVIALAPVLWSSLPMAMVDYPNHLARMFVLARDGTTHSHPYYQTEWALIPNLAMDLIVPPIGRLIGVEMATRLFYLASQILIITGAMAIERVVKGRLHIAGFFALMFLYSLPFALGFMNFQFALGCALWGIAFALMVQERPWPIRLALHTAVIAALFVAHLFALGVYGFAVGLQELYRAWSLRAPLSQTVTRLALMALPTLVIVGVMRSSGTSVGGHGTEWLFTYKPAHLLHIMSGYSMAVSRFSLVSLLLTIALMARRGMLRFEQSGAWQLVGFCALYLALPGLLFDTAYVDIRAIVAAGLIVPAFVSVSFPNRAWASTALTVAVAIILASATVVTSVWWSYRTDFATAMASFRMLTKRAKVLIGSNTDVSNSLSDLRDYPIYNIPTLAVQYADAFVPSLFTDAGKQPVRPRPQWGRLDVPYGRIQPAKSLVAIARHGASIDTPEFVRNWTRDFDYLYLIGSTISNPMPELLEEIARGPRFALYRIRKGAKE